VADWGGGIMVCLYAAPRAMDGRVMRRGIIGSFHSVATSKIEKALLVTSVTHAICAIASKPLLSLPLLWTETYEICKKTMWNRRE